MKIVLDKEDITYILKEYVFNVHGGALKVHDMNQIVFNDWLMPYDNFVFEKKHIIEVKIEDVEDMVIEQLKTRGEQDAV